MKTSSIVTVIIIFLMTGCKENGKQLTDDFITVDVTAKYPKRK